MISLSSEKKVYTPPVRRLTELAVIIVLALALLMARLWYLQVERGDHYAMEAERNRLSLPQTLKAARGVIYGNDGQTILADDRPSYDLMVLPAECTEDVAAGVCERLERLADVDGDALLERLEAGRDEPFKMILVKPDISRTMLTRLEEYAAALPGVNSVIRTERRYPQGKVAGQIVGQLGKINKAEYARMKDEYKRDDWIGRRGLERQYEPILHGEDGYTLVTRYAEGNPVWQTDAYGRPYIEFNTFGRPLEEVQEFRRDPVQGGAVHTTLDVDLQRFAEETLINAPPEFADPYGVIRGAIVVLDADTGAVLALASTPRYDPSVFTKHGSAYIRQRMALLGLDEQGEEKPEEGDPEAGANVAEVREAMVEDVNPEVLAAEDGADGAAGGQSAASPGAEGAASQPEAAREAPPQAADAETEGRGGAETAPEQSAGASGRNNEGIRVDDFPKAAPASPMFNRCYEGIYPPGSVYKVLMALVALEEGVVTPETTFYCGGLYRMPGVSRPWRCHKRSGHGQVNMIDALTVSCDVYFYNVGQRLADTAPEAADMLHAYAKKLGLGVETGLDIPGERAGLIPSQAWKVAMDKQENADYPHDWGFFPGHILNMSIGQGDVLMTPLQGATLVAAVVNGGRRVRPYLNRALEPDRTAPLFSSETVEVVRRAMLNCVERDHFPSGTGRRAKIEGLDIIGKTGTAQVVAISHYKDLPELEQPYQIRDHAWFVAGVLNREPRIAVSVVVEHGLHGGSTASILARDVIEYFYKRDDERRDVKLARGEAN